MNQPATSVGVLCATTFSFSRQSFLARIFESAAAAADAKSREDAEQTHRGRRKDANSGDSAAAVCVSRSYTNSLLDKEEAKVF